MMLRCRDATRLSSKSLDAPLSLRERLGLRFHLLMCRACSRYGRQLRHLHEVLRQGVEVLDDLDVLTSFRLSGDDREQMLRAVAAETSGET